MAYTKNTWQTGDIVSSAKLNHMEDGIANSENVFIVGGVSVDGNGDPNGTLDKTWQEIYDALQSKVVIAVYVSDNEIMQFGIEGCLYDDGDNAYKVPVGQAIFTTASRDGYPSLSGGTDPFG